MSILQLHKKQSPRLKNQTKVYQKSNNKYHWLQVKKALSSKEKEPEEQNYKNKDLQMVLLKEFRKKLKKIKRKKT